MDSKRVMHKNEHFGGTNETSVGKFRCLSKSWRTLLSTTQFIKSHLSRKPQQKIHSYAQAFTCSFNPQMMVDRFTEMWGSCNGLVLLETGSLGMSVFNPTTLQQLYVPDSPLARNKNEFGTVYGFGYDSSSDEYKIVKLSCYKGPDDGYYLVTYVDVYSLERGVWNRVISSPNGHVHYNFLPGAFVNNAIHWLNVSKESGASTIAAFDLANEVFYDVCGPTDVKKELLYLCDLVVLDGRLCIGEMLIENIVFWMMKEYDSVESWTTFSIRYENVNCFCEIKPLCLFGNEDEKLLVSSEAEDLAVCNLKERTCERMDTDGLEFVSGESLVESLVSPFLIA
ncbi:hypothetical protein ACJIZ3_021894 [Penstemon smallii]|uniref:F-box associated beta-propeller type 1 domain-containing protein n=1 Tax=Penstemon smallii TaxID=265156 RepID=A0ABD3SNC0_9LAMI